MAPPVTSAVFWARTDQSGGPASCWPWLGHVERNGYGRLMVAYHHTLAHRHAYALEHGPIPPGMQLDHLCRNRACCNPAHLEPVTAAVNIGRGLTGTNNASKTHCPSGHPYDEANTYPYRGNRQCRSCNRERQRARKAA